MRRRRCGWLLVVWLAAGCAPFAPQLDPRTAQFPPLRFEPPVPRVAHLDSGLPVYLLEDHDLPLVRVYLGFRGGSAYDPPDRAGLAAVAAAAWREGGAGGLEPAVFDRELEERAIDLSVSGGREVSWIQLSCLSAELPRALELLGLLVHRPRFDAERLEWSKVRTQEGIRRLQDDPEALAFREWRRAVYRGHPRGRAPTLESVAAITREEVRALHGAWTGAGRWLLGVVGDFEAGAVLEQCELLFGNLPVAGTRFAPLPSPAPPQSRVVVVPKALPQAVVVWGKLAPERLADDYHALDLADHILGGSGFQSRLVREIRSDRGLAYSVGSFYQALAGFGVLGTFLQTGTENLTTVLALHENLLAELAGGGVRAEELRAARQALVNRYVFRYQDVALSVRERMGYSLQGLPEDLAGRYVAGVQSVTVQQVDAAAAHYYRYPEGVLVVVGDVALPLAGLPGGVPVEVRDPQQ